MHAVLLGWVQVLAVSLASTAWATPMFFASVQIRNDRTPVTDSGPTSATVGPRTQDIQNGSNSFASEGTATALPGSLSVLARGRASGRLNCGSFAVLPKACGAAAAQAQMTLDDIVITGPATNVVTSLNFNLAGTIDASANANPDPSDGLATAVSEMGFGVSLSSSLFTSSSFASGRIRAEHVDFAGTSPDDKQFLKRSFSGTRGPFGTGVTNGQSNLTIVSISTTGGNIETFPVTLPVGEPITLSLNLSVSAGAVLAGRGHVSADSLFFNTLSFPESGPVFNLPADYTVSSTQGLISDNAWLGGTPTASAPEPATVALIGIGIFGVGFARKCRKNSRSGYSGAASHAPRVRR